MIRDAHSGSGSCFFLLIPDPGSVKLIFNIFHINRLYVWIPYGKYIIKYDTKENVARSFYNIRLIAPLVVKAALRILLLLCMCMLLFTSIQIFTAWNKNKWRSQFFSSLELAPPPPSANKARVPSCLAFSSSFISVCGRFRLCLFRLAEGRWVQPIPTTAKKRGLPNLFLFHDPQGSQPTTPIAIYFMKLMALLNIITVLV